MSLEFAKEFSAETGVFGLHLFTRRRSTCEVVFWLCFVTVFSCYTTKSLVNICCKYLGEEVITFVQQKRSADFELPAPQVCFIGKPAYRDWSIDEDEPVSIDQFLVGNNSNGTSFLHAVKLVQQLVLREWSMIPRGPDFLSSTMKPKLVEPNLAAVLQTIAAVNGASLENISASVFQTFCRGLHLRVTFWNSTANISQNVSTNCEREKIGFAFVEQMFSICVDIDPSELVFRSAYDYLSIELNTSAILEELALETDQIWFDLDAGRYFFMDGDFSDFDAKFDFIRGKRIVQYIRILALYQNLDLRRRPCDEDRRRSMLCEGRCKSRFFVDAYGCWPIFYVYQLSLLAENVSAIRRCDVKDYFGFKAATQEGMERCFDCLRACLSPCSNPVFAITTDRSMAGGETTAGRIYVNSHVYSLVEERLANDFEGFLASFGGALGLWLGASFASVVHIPIFIGQAIGRLIRRKKSKHADLVKKESKMSKKYSPETKEGEMVTLDAFEALEKMVKEEKERILQRLDALEKIYRNDSK